MNVLLGFSIINKEVKLFYQKFYDLYGKEIKEGDWIYITDLMFTSQVKATTFGLAFKTDMNTYHLLKIYSHFEIISKSTHPEHFLGNYYEE